MRSRVRLIAALGVAALCVPGNILRTHVPDTIPQDIALEQIASASDTGTPGWRVEGVWQYAAGGLNFGGYSALLALSNGRLRAFSDRGTRFTFAEPDQPGDLRSVVHQLVEPRWANKLWDIEAATRDPVTGDYWLAFESTHGFHRYSAASERGPVRVLGDEVEWTVNSGAEAMQRLADGRFLVIAEGESEALLYPSDPVEGAKARGFEWQNPAPDHVVTDLAQLPDGRLLLLMRGVDWGYPPFASLIAIADLPDPDATELWSPRVALRLEGVVPRENYEGMAVRELEDGRVAVWIISDDNLSVMQRTLLAKLVLDPQKLGR